MIQYLYIEIIYRYCCKILQLLSNHAKFYIIKYRIFIGVEPIFINKHFTILQ